MFQPRKEMFIIPTNDDGTERGPVHGLLYAVPISVLLWAIILFCLFAPQ